MTTPARPGQFTGATDNAASGGLFTDTLVDGIPDIIGADVASAQASATAAKISETNAAASAEATASAETATAADRIATNADVVLTHADVVLTHADVVLTNADVNSISGSVTAAADSADNAADSADAASGSATSASASLTNTNSARDTAVSAATTAGNAATAAGLSETAAETAEDNAQDWAVKVDGIVDSADYSSKAWSIGGTGVTNTANKGPAKDWAIKAEDTTVDGTNFSALHYSAKSAASATTASTAVTTTNNNKADAQKLAINPEDSQFTLSDGSTTGYSALHYNAKAEDFKDSASGFATTATTQATKSENYAVKVDGVVPSTSDYSSKAWATGGTGVDHASGAGNAKDWATETTTTADNTEYSSKEYAIGIQAGNTSGSAKQWALGGGNFVMATPVTGSGGTAKYSAAYWADRAASTVANFDEFYYGSYASDTLAENAHEAAGKTVNVGDLYYNTDDSAIKYCVAVQVDPATVGTWLPVQATDTTSFATKGFSIAMSIAL